VLALACSCSRQQSGSLERFAFLPFENLTGDSSLEWIRTASPQIAAQELAGLKDIVAFPATDLRDAQVKNATRFIHGYVDRRAPGGSIHLEIAVEDSADRRMTRTSAFDGDVLAVTNGLAKSINSEAKPFSTSNAAALEAWGTGDLDRAISLDPDFGGAWLAKIQKLTVARDLAGARATANDALRRSTLKTPLDRAQIEVAFAALRNDPDARAKALAGLTALLPNDTQLLRTLADSELIARRFADAARLYEQLSKLPSPSPDIFNQLGYACALTGDLTRARKAFEEYSRQPGQEANSFDSLGEALFLNGQFAEAEKKFLEAHEKSAAMLAGGDLLKAAYARWLQGDLKGADEIHSRYLEFRKQGKDALVPWHEAVWLFATGRSEAALERLQSVPKGTNAQLDTIITRQLTVWRTSPLPVAAGIDAIRKLYESTQPLADGLVRTLYAEELLKAGNREEAAKLVQRWPLTDNAGDALVQSYVFPRFLAVRSKLQ
jgi:tetratricopeptide (TPR) repeat protein